MPISENPALLLTKAPFGHSLLVIVDPRDGTIIVYFTDIGRLKVRPSDSSLSSRGERSRAKKCSSKSKGPHFVAIWWVLEEGG